MNKARLGFIIFWMLLWANFAQTQGISSVDEDQENASEEFDNQKTISTALRAKIKHKIDSLTLVRDNEKNSPKKRVKAQGKIVLSILYKDTKNSLPAIKKYLEISTQFQDSIKSLGVALCYLGYYYRQQELYDSARYAYQEALKYATKQKLVINGLNARINLAIVDEKQGNYDLALEGYLTVLDSCIFYKKKDPEARCRINIGMLYYLRGDYTAALTQLQKALDLCKKGKLAGYIASVYMYLGDVNHAIGEIEMAEDYYTKAIKSSDAVNNSNIKRLALIQYIHLKAEQKNYREAITLAQRLLVFEKDYAFNVNRYAEVLFLMADLFDKSGQIDSAQYYIHQSLDAYKKAEFSEKLYQAYGIAGTIYLHKKDLTKAEGFCKKSYELNESQGDAEQQKINCYSLYQIYKQKNNAALALRYFEEYNSLMDKIQDKEEAKKIVKIQLNSQFQNKQFRDSLQNHREKELMELQHAQKLESRTRLTWFLLIGLATVLLITLILWYAFRQNKKQKEDLDKLNQLNKQIFSIISHDFRSPLMSMNFMAEALVDSEMDEMRMRLYLKDIKNQIAQTSNILENLLNWARAELQIDIKQNLETNLVQITKELEQSIAPKLEEKELEFINGFSENIVLTIHPDLLRIVLRNLINNAIKYSHQEGKIELNYNPILKQIAIKDTGVGMDEKQVGNLFKQPVFSQMGTDEETGFGIGLYISSELLRKIGWSITVQSEKGKGTIFFVNAKK